MEIRKAGLESSQLIIGVDFTKSNLWTGQESFAGKSLHDCFTGKPNPYQEVPPRVPHIAHSLLGKGRMPLSL